MTENNLLTSVITENYILIKVFRILITGLTGAECQLITHRQEMTARRMRRICVYFYDAHSLLHNVAVSRVSVCIRLIWQETCAN